MRSLIAGLARQSLVAAGLSALVVAAVLAARPSHNQAAVAADGSLDKPILAKAIVTAAQPAAAAMVATSEPQPASAAASLAPAAKAPELKKPARQACAAPCGKAVAAPHPRTVTTAPEPVVVASAAPVQQADPPSPSLRKRLFAPVGFIRQNVVRLIQWL